MYLPDTHIVSGLRRPKPHGAVLEWIHDATDADLHISAATIGAIQAGIAVTRQHDEAKAAELERWLAQVSDTFNIMSMDAPTFHQWAQLMHVRSETRFEAAMIAATARVHKFRVVTRNIGTSSTST